MASTAATNNVQPQQGDMGNQQQHQNNSNINNNNNNNNRQVSIHIREDSDSELQALFDVALKGAQRPLQVPMRMRNLPMSFFQPPTQGSKSPSVHSRENSLDSSSCGALGAPFSPGGGNGGGGAQFSPGGAGMGSPQPAPGGHHSRANSCPATLGQTLAVAQQQVQNHSLQHLRQQSYDVGGGGGLDELGPLPPGWEMAKAPNGQIYFMNHISKTTQWEDPRKAIHQQMLNQMNGTASPRSSATQSPLPGAGANGAPVDLGPLPQGWEQSVTPEGEVYFIHHVTKRTTWYDPRIPIQAQVVPQKQGQEAAHSQKIQQERRLKRLEMERRVLQQKRAELSQYLRQQETTQQAITQTQEMMMRHSLSDAGGPTNLDPFMNNGQAGANNSEMHNRQESADSGLGMGSNFNLGSIPEDMGLENMDTDLDTTLTDSNQQPNAGDQGGPQQQQPQGQMGGTGAAGQAHTNMEADDLMSSLPELGEELSRDFMNTIFNGAGPNGGNGNPPAVGDNELTWL